MLSEAEAIKLATDYLSTRKKVQFTFHSVGFLPAASKPGIYKLTGDTWVVRFTRVLPPGVDETGLTMVDVDSSTGRIIEDPF